MAVINFYHDTRSTSNKKEVEEQDRLYTLKLCISHRKVRKYINTGYRLRKRDWDDVNNKIKRSFPNSQKANFKLSKLWMIASEVISYPKETLKTLSANDLYLLINQKHTEQEEGTFEALKGIYATKIKEYGSVVVKERYENAKRHSSAEKLRSAIKAFLKFHGNDELSFKEIDEDFLVRMEVYWLGKGCGLGGLAIHMQAIRTLYNIAIKDKTTELTLADYPFGNYGYSIKKVRSKKRALDQEDIERIMALDYEEGSDEWHHRNYFLFSFYTRGMNFKDLAFLKPNNFNKGYVFYQRAKTKRKGSVKEFKIKLIDKAIDILNYYLKDQKPQEYVFPILNYSDDANSLEMYKHYRRRSQNYNRKLKTIGKDAEIPNPLTSYVARHSFASIGLSKKIAPRALSEMLGHTDTAMSENYFKELDSSILDNEASLIFSF